MASKKSTAPAAQAETQPEASATKREGLPLFFQQPAALEKSRHALAAISSPTDIAFAKSTNSIAVNALEFIEAGKFYPIVFTMGDTSTPLAIVGLEQENYFIDKKNNWREGTYIPAYVRQYPFIFFENPEEEKFFLCVDEKSSQFHINGAEGARDLFNADGSASPLTNQALEFCTTYYQHHKITMSFTDDLLKHKLLQPYQSQATLKSGRKISLSGFAMIDEKAFNELSDEVYLEFRTKGWLPFIILALASSSNWGRLSNMAETE